MALDEEVLARLNRAFKSSRVVFWEDGAGEFLEEAQTSELSDALPDIFVHRVDNNEFGVKFDVLREHKNERHLIYRAGGAPDISEDFLLDVKLFAKNFTVSKAAVHAEELGLPASCLGVVEAHNAFFNAKERREDLAALLANASWLEGAVTPRALESALVAVCCKAKGSQRSDMLAGIARALFREVGNKSNEVEKLLARCGLEDALWTALNEGFGYSSSKPEVRDFVFEAVANACTDLTEAQPTLWADASVVLDSLAHDNRYQEAYKKLMVETVDYLLSQCDVAKLSLDTLAAHQLMPFVDAEIVRRLEADVSEGLDCRTVIESVQGRRAGTVWYSAWEGAYACLAAATVILSGERTFESELSKADTAEKLLNEYTNSWVQTDAAYRSFIRHLPAARKRNDFLFASLAKSVEAAYLRFVTRLAVVWQDKILETGVWPPETNTLFQGDFARSRVELAKLQGRVAVIISDALRYELGAAWQTQASAGGRLQAKLTPMIAALPSYTQLGMAMLLPHNTATFDSGTQLASCDGRDTTGLEARKAVLQKRWPDANAVQATELLRSGGAAAFSETSVLYVYHNKIDKVGDNTTTEQEVFTAADDALSQIDELVAMLLKAGFKTVLITADHGFLYQDDKSQVEFAEVDYASLTAHCEGADKARRFVAARSLPDADVMMRFKASDLGLHGNFEVALPKGVRRLRLQGSGSRFVHGGMTLQEVVVPVIEVQKKPSSEPYAVNPVGVDILRGGNSFINGPTISFEVYQREPVSDTGTSRKVRVRACDSTGNLVSDVFELTLASTSSEASERRFPVTLTIAGTVSDGATVKVLAEGCIAGTHKYLTIAEQTYTVRRAFGMDF